jgi:hypothetical protein
MNKDDDNENHRDTAIHTVNLARIPHFAMSAPARMVHSDLQIHPNRALRRRTEKSSGGPFIAHNSHEPGLSLDFTSLNRTPWVSAIDTNENTFH